jgi:CubicO group peptidase (beta-lactamase class C family)
MRSFLLTFAFCIVAGAQSGPTGSGLDPSRLATIRPHLQALVDNQTIPGAVALVSRHGRVALVEAVGWRDVENKKPMEAGSIFQIMSMTKNFTGVAVMMLADEGKIDLRQPVEHYLPEFRGIRPPSGSS